MKNGKTHGQTLGQILGQTHGQALVMLLVFMVIAITITSMAVAFVIINASAASDVEEADRALKVSESGAENALIRLIRDPDYTGTETLTIDGGSVTSTVSAGIPIRISAEGHVGSFVRTTSVSASFVDSILVVGSWQEVP